MCLLQTASIGEVSTLSSKLDYFGICDIFYNVIKSVELFWGASWTISFLFYRCDYYW